MSAPTNYINSAQQRVLQIMLLLAGREFDGAAPGELAKAVHTGASNVTRDLANLKQAGLAEQLESGRWRLAPRMVQIANAHNQARLRIDEYEQRYSRLPR